MFVIDPAFAGFSIIDWNQEVSVLDGTFFKIRFGANLLYFNIFKSIIRFLLKKIQKRHILKAIHHKSLINL